MTREWTPAFSLALLEGWEGIGADVIWGASKEMSLVQP